MGNEEVKEVKKLPQVEVEMRRLQEAVIMVESVTEKISDRLGSIARPALNTDEIEDIGDPRPERVELAERLHVAELRINEVGVRLLDLLERLEL